MYENNDEGTVDEKTQNRLRCTIGCERLRQAQQSSDYKRSKIHQQEAPATSNSGKYHNIRLRLLHYLKFVLEPCNGIALTILAAQLANLSSGAFCRLSLVFIVKTPL